MKKKIMLFLRVKKNWQKSKIKEENEKLKEWENEKMSLYKLASEKKEKLNQILDEIKKMSA